MNEEAGLILKIKSSIDSQILILIFEMKRLKQFQLT